jgi:hypothetical protein
MCLLRRSFGAAFVQAALIGSGCVKLVEIRQKQAGILCPNIPQSKLFTHPVTITKR